MNAIQVPHLFVYGILKRGKALDLSRHGGKFLGEATLRDANIYRIGGGVGLRLNEPGGLVHGEVFEIPDVGIKVAEENPAEIGLLRFPHAHLMWHWLDEIENNGVVYTRKVVEPAFDIGDSIKAWVYEHNHAHFRESEKIKDGVYRGNY